MLILAIDSTAKISSAALLRDGTPLGEVTLNTGNTHSETLLPSVEFLLSSARLTVADIDVFACAVGPGSFTGVRIGAATIKGLAFGRGQCCAAVGTLEALAERAADMRGIVVPVMDARRDQVYTAVFDCADCTPRRLTPDDAMSVDELGELLTSHSAASGIDTAGRMIYFVGDGYDLVHDRLASKLPNIADTPRDLRDHSALSAARAAHRRLASGELTLNDAGTLSPTYLRLSQAEREYNEKHKNDQNT